MKHHITGLGKERGMSSIISVHEKEAESLGSAYSRRRSNPQSVLLDYTSPKIGIMHGLFPGVKESRRQERLGHAFNTVVAAQARSKNQEGFRFRDDEGRRITLYAIMPYRSELQASGVVIGGIQSGYVLLKRRQDGTFHLSAGDSQGPVDPPSVRKVSKALARFNKI